jgi:hypothetical protein
MKVVAHASVRKSSIGQLYPCHALSVVVIPHGVVKHPGCVSDVNTLHEILLVLGSGRKSWLKNGALIGTARFSAHCASLPIVSLSTFDYTRPVVP